MLPGFSLPKKKPLKYLLTNVTVENGKFLFEANIFQLSRIYFKRMERI